MPAKLASNKLDEIMNNNISLENQEDHVNKDVDEEDKQDEEQENDEDDLEENV